MHNLMLHGKGSVLPHLVPKGPRFVEIIDNQTGPFIFIIFHKYTFFHKKLRLSLMLSTKRFTIFLLFSIVMRTIAHCIFIVIE